MCKRNLLSITNTRKNSRVLSFLLLGTLVGCSNEFASISTYGGYLGGGLPQEEKTTVQVDEKAIKTEAYSVKPTNQASKIYSAESTKTTTYRSIPSTRKVYHQPKKAVKPQNLNLKCGGKRYCYQMNSCTEAKFYLRQCGLRRLDRDGDGVPCESLCG